MHRTLTSVVALIVLVVIFVAINMIGGALLRSARIDFTEARLYTLNPGSKNIAGSLEEPITLDFYYSSKLAAGRPALQSYGQRVGELLEEYERIARGRILLRVHDPEAFSDIEDQALQYGLQGVPMGDAGERFYFGLVGANAVGDRTNIRFFDPQDEEFLEYEISRMIYTLANPELRILGLISGLEIGGTLPPEGQPTGGAPAWQVAREIAALYQVRRVDPNDGRLPSELDVLLIVHPKKLPDPMLYAIDQYVLRGGRAMIFVDPHSESDLPPDPRDPVARLTYKAESNLPGLFKAWGVTMNPEETAADLRNAQGVMYLVSPGRREPAPYVLWLGLSADFFNPEDPVTGKLSRLHFATSGVLDPLPEATTTFIPLIWTSDQSMRMDSARARTPYDPKELVAIFAASGKPLTLAARITGEAGTAFADGPPDGSPPSPIQHLNRSLGPIDVIVVADTDILADRFWLQQSAGGGVSKIADNGDFLVNGLDNLSGSDDLVSLRARGGYDRPFDRVVELRAKAEESYRAQERQLQQEIRETQQRIEQIQNERPESAVILSPEVQDEILQLQTKLLDARKQLREVQFDLRRDVESLGTRLKIINTALAPAIIAITAIGLSLSRASRRRADRRAMAQM